MEWVYQKDKNIDTKIGCSVTNFELLMNDGSIVEAIGMAVECYDGQVYCHLSDVKTLEPIDYDKIVKWKIKMTDKEYLDKAMAYIIELLDGDDKVCEKLLSIPEEHEICSNEVLHI